MKKFLVKYRNAIFIIATISMIVAVVLLTIKLWPFFLSLKNPANRDEFIFQMKSFGFGGIIVAILIQFFQVVIAIIPGEPIELALGIVYGGIGGLVISLIGVSLASAFIFMIVKIYGKGLVNYIFTNEKTSKLKFLHNSKKLDILLFVLFLIPGTPKDIITYFAPLTKIKLSRFLIISTIARIPSIVSSTLAGEAIESGKWLTTIIIFVVTGVLGIAGIIINNKIHEKGNKEIS